MGVDQVTTELEQALALLFRRARDTPADENELAKIMSLTLSWTKPSKATNLLARGVNAGLLERTDGGYTPTFDAQEIEVGFGFQPSESLFEAVAGTQPAPEPSSTEDPGPEAQARPAQAEPGEAVEPEPQPGLDAGQPSAAGPALLEELIDAIAERLEEGRQRAVAQVNAKQESVDGILTLEAAGLLVADEVGIDAAPWAKRVLEDLTEAR